jgi:hypothetical protein
MRVYSQIEEDLNDIGDKPDEEKGKKLSEPTIPLTTSKPKATIQAKDSSKNIKEVDVTESEMFLKMVDSYLNSENLTVKELNQFYSNETNNPKFDKLQKELPKYYETIIEKFKSVKQSLQNKETN